VIDGDDRDPRRAHPLARCRCAGEVPL
jgi:hypothetical protein